jgi:hypothetical protein
VSGACPLLKKPANLIGIQVHDVLPEIHGVVAAVPGGSSGVIDMASNKKYAAIRARTKG